MNPDLPYALTGLDTGTFHWENSTLFLNGDFTPADASMYHMLLEPAVLYKNIKAMDAKQGLFHQALWECVDSILYPYHILVADLQRSAGEHRLGLVGIYNLLVEPTNKMRALYHILARCLQARSLLVELYRYTNHGDPLVADLARELYQQTSKPLEMLLSDWTTQGIINDPFGEFFVEFKNPESVWSDRFSLNVSKLPPDISAKEAAQIFEVGKSKYFAKQLCGESVLVAGGNITEILETKYSLRHHLRALFHYLFLAKGDFANALLESALPVLSGDHVHRVDLVTILETAIASSTAQYEKVEIIQRLDARTLELGQGEPVWQVFTLEYKLDSPLDAIIDKRANRKYLQIFNLLWRLRWAVANLTVVYRLVNSRNSPFTRTNDESLIDCWRLQADLCQLMQQPLLQLLNYIYATVLETQWRALEQQLNSATSVDAIQKAHQLYLSNVFEKALFGGGKPLDLLRSLADTVTSFSIVVRDCIEDLDNFSGTQELEEIRLEWERNLIEFKELLQTYRDDDTQMILAQLS